MMRGLGPAVILTLAAVCAADVRCNEKDIEMNAEDGSYYIPAKCTHLKIDGDHPHTDLIIEAVEMHPALTHLDLSRDPWRIDAPNGVNIDDVLALVDVLPQSNVEHLDLSFNWEVGDAGIKVIAEDLPKLGLTSLHLQSVHATNSGMEKLLEAIKSDQQLLRLNLGRNRLTDVVLEKLARVVTEHPTLKNVKLEGHGNLHREIDAVVKGRCVYSEWSTFSKCQGECGDSATSVRTRRVLRKPHARHLAITHGECEGPLVEEKACTVRCRGEVRTGDRSAQLPPPRTADLLTGEVDWAHEENLAKSIAAQAAKEAAEAEEAAKEAAEAVETAEATDTSEDGW